MPIHTCDREGPPAIVVDESAHEPITRIHSTCSVCGVPQVFNVATRTEQLIAKLATLSPEDRDLIARLVDLCSSAQPTSLEDVRSRAEAVIAHLERRH